jgi:NAD(P)-dependent dehydrogenase (short-subunit alcohol dehydrogenase family)
MARLENKVTVITGAASGIGRASASLFAREGAVVVLADLKREAGEAAAAEIVAAGGRAEFVVTDV